MVRIEDLSIEEREQIINYLIRRDSESTIKDFQRETIDYLIEIRAINKIEQSEKTIEHAKQSVERLDNIKQNRSDISQRRGFFHSPDNES